MKIVINFDSCWLNGFLDEEDGLVVNRKGISKPKVRKFFATSKSEKTTTRNLSKDTVMGVLCRLIGDQRKLYKARYEDDYYFKGCEDSINFEIESEQMPFDEKVMIINKSDHRPAQSTYLGVLPNDISLFSSEYSQNLWHVLDMTISELCDYILNETMVFEPKEMVSLNHILNRISDLTNLDINPPIKTIDRLLAEYDDQIDKQNEKLSLLDSSDEKYKKKSETLNAKIFQLLDERSKILNNEAGIIFDRKIKDTAEKIQANFRKSKIIKDGVIYPITLYGAALYLNAIKLKSENIIRVELTNLIFKNTPKLTYL